MFWVLLWWWWFLCEFLPFPFNCIFILERSTSHWYFCRSVESFLLGNVQVTTWAILDESHSTMQGSLYICACSEPVIMGDRSPLNIISSPGRKQQYNILSSASAHNCDYAVLKTQATVCIFKCILNAVTQFTGPKSLLSGIQRCPVKYLNLSFDDVLHCIWR